MLRSLLGRIMHSVRSAALKDCQILVRALLRGPQAAPGTYSALAELLQPPSALFLACE